MACCDLLSISAMLRKMRESVKFKNIYLKFYEVLDHMFIPEETIIHLLPTINIKIITTDTFQI